MSCSIPNQKALFPPEDRDYRSDNCDDDTLANWCWEEVPSREDECAIGRKIFSSDESLPAIVDENDTVHFPHVYDSPGHSFIPWDWQAPQQRSGG